MRWTGILAAILLVATLSGLPGLAHADAIDSRAKQLTSASDYKLRLSAALWLAKKSDIRSIRALTYALENDSASTIRQVAAKSLGKLIDTTTPEKARKRALDVLELAAKNDSSADVRKAASRSLDRLSSLVESGPRVYVHIGKPSFAEQSVPSTLRDDLTTTLQGVVRDQAPDFLVSWPAGDLPTKAELERTKTRAYMVAARVAKVDVRKKGGQTEVACSVTIQVNPWEGKDGKERWAAHQTASATGSGKVIGQSSDRGVANAKLDCVLAVAEQIATKQVIPFVKKLATTD